MNKTNEPNKATTSRLFSSTNEKIAFVEIASPSNEQYINARQEGMSELIEKNKSYGIAYFMSKDKFVGNS